MPSFDRTPDARAVRRAPSLLLLHAALAALAACGGDTRTATGPRPGARAARAVQPAANPVVNTLADVGDGVCDEAACTLREALALAARVSPNVSFVSFAEGLTGTITLGGELQLASAGVNVVGPSAGAGITVKSGNGRVLQTTGTAQVALSNLTLVGGPGVGEGGAVYNAGTLSLQHVTITGSTALNGGAIFNTGTLYVANGTIAGNVARRGGVGGVGGGIANRGTLNLVYSTVSGNVADDGAGGAGRGGGLDVASADETWIRSSIVAGNRAAAAPDFARTSDSPFLVVASVIGDGTGSGVPDGAGQSRIGSAAAPVDARLAPLADDGGGTRTMALLAGSPAVDFVPSAFSCDGSDQRYVARPQGPRCDAGAYELVQTPVPPANRPPTAVAGGPYAAAEGAGVHFDAGASADPDGDALTYAWAFGDGTTAAGAAPTHAYADDGTYIATLTVTDGRGGSTTQTVAVQVTNVAPTATFAATPPSPAQGQVLTLAFTAPQDVAADLAGLEYAFDCGEGAGFGPFGAAANARCSTAAAGVRTVRGAVRDGDGALTDYEATVDVRPVLGPGAIALGRPHLPAPALNAASAGATVALHFAAALPEPGTLAAGFPQSAPIDCETRAPAGAPSAAASPTGLQYDATSGRYLYAWRTERAWGGGCRRLTLRLATGEQLDVDFRFR